MKIHLIVGEVPMGSRFVFRGWHRGRSGVLLGNLMAEDAYQSLLTDIHENAEGSNDVTVRIFKDDEFTHAEYICEVVNKVFPNVKFDVMTVVVNVTDDLPF